MERKLYKEKINNKNFLFNKKDIESKKWNIFSTRFIDTLLIIGFALLMSIIGINKLYENYQKKIYVSTLKMAQSVIEEGFKIAIAENDANSIFDTPIWVACNIRNIDETSEKCKSELGKYFAGIKTYTKKHRSEDTVNTFKDKKMCQALVGNSNMWWHLNSSKSCSGWDNYTFYFNKGMKVDALIIGSNDSYLAGQLILDVNGDASPNMWGRDTFMYNILEDGSIIPYSGYTDCEKLAEYTKNDLNYVLHQRHWKYADTCSAHTTFDGTACAARIVENAWKMDY